jgi:hypothetical protein
LRHRVLAEGCEFRGEARIVLGCGGGLHVRAAV